MNYPHVIAAAVHARLTDVTCGAAETEDFAGSQYPGVAPQLDAVQSNTQLITMGHPCQDKYGSSFDDTIAAPPSIEPVVGGTNPVIVHPNALGESKMAARTQQVLKLG